MKSTKKRHVGARMPQHSQPDLVPLQKHPLSAVPWRFGDDDSPMILLGPEIATGQFRLTARLNLPGLRPESGNVSLILAGRGMTVHSDPVEPNALTWDVDAQHVSELAEAFTTLERTLHALGVATAPGQ